MSPESEAHGAHRPGLSWLQRFWFASTLLIGILMTYAVPPFQTNDEHSHWLHMWGVAYGGFRCGAPKPNAAIELPEMMHIWDVRSTPGAWRWQYLRSMQKFVGDAGWDRAEGTACGYQPLPYLPSGLVARLIAFGPRGRLRRGSMLSAVYAARLANWILFSAVVLLVCRRLRWCSNVTLAFYSLPEVIQQGMAINTDSFLLACTGLLLFVLFGMRTTTRTQLYAGAIVALMTMTKIVYAPLVGCGLILLERLIVRHGWRLRDVAALLASAGASLAAYWLWIRWQTSGAPSAAPDSVTLRAAQQMAFLKQHPATALSVLHYQWKYLFIDGFLIKGSWESILGAFGWGTFTMALQGYHAVLLAAGLAAVADMLAARPSIEAPARRWGWLALIAALACVFVVIVGVVLAMYIYFTGGYLGIVGGPDAIGVQGRYYLVPIWLGAVLLLSGLRLRRALPVWVAGLPDVLTAAAALLCAVGNVRAIEAILSHFYAYALS